MRTARAFWFFPIFAFGIFGTASPAMAARSSPGAPAQRSPARPGLISGRRPSCAGSCASTNTNPGISESRLSSVAAASSSDVWAVGSFIDDATFITETLIEHYDGTTWSAVPNPNPGTVRNELFAVSASGPADVWAVGDFVDGIDAHGYSSTDLRTLVEHWDGTAWTMMSTPTPPLGGQLYAVAAVSPTDVWAVGGYFASI
jgi:hypothetical protein